MQTINLLTHYFIPGYSNNQKAKLLHPVSVFLMIATLIIYQIALQLIPSTGVAILGYAANIPAARVIEITNQKREEEGLVALATNPVLNNAAEAKGKHMLEYDYWAHVAPDGTEPWKFFTDAGYEYKYAGENLARDFSTASSAVDAWLASPSHRENLLSSKYTEIGVAVVEGDLDGVDTTLIVQLFGTPRVDTVPQVPIARADITVETAGASATQPTPTAISTIAPTPKPTPIVPVAGVEGLNPPSSTPVLISPFTATKAISVATVFLMLSTLVVDGVITSRRKVTRIAGRTFAHLAFLGMILAIALIARAGAII